VTDRNLSRLSYRSLIVFGLFIAAPFAAQAQSSGVAAPAAATKSASAKALDRGGRVFICGHSFHIFTARHLGPIAQAAKLGEHVTVGSQMIGGSSVTQHWNLADEKNRCKEALKSGEVDVLTLSPNWVIPDPAIEKFVDLALEHNPAARIVVQMSWTAFDGFLPGQRIARNEERDAKTIAELMPVQEGFAKLIEKQVDEINAKHDRSVVAISPVGYAVLKLRQAIIDGKAPGLTKQSQLFRDILGHGTEPLMALVSYVNFATIYGVSPVGLAPFDTFGGAVPPELHKLLQQIAWETVTGYAHSGVKAAAK
jgi:hypothetical protein